MNCELLTRFYDRIIGKREYIIYLFIRVLLFHQRFAHNKIIFGKYKIILYFFKYLLVHCYWIVIDNCRKEKLKYFSMKRLK